jgi:hypothetical protein
MHRQSAAKAARLREEASLCRLLARLMSLNEDTRRLLEEGQAYDARAEAIERALVAERALAA